MYTQTCQLVLSPDLEVSPEAFAVAWNEIDERGSYGQARLSQQNGTQYDLSLVAGALITENRI
jgi:hypothetical protein